MKTTTKTKSSYVIAADGLRMSYEEWFEMKKNEKD